MEKIKNEDFQEKLIVSLFIFIYFQSWVKWNKQIIFLGQFSVGLSWSIREQVFLASGGWIMTLISGG